MAYLVLMEGSKEGQRYELPKEGEVTLGRAPGNMIVIDGPSVSGSHCRISIRGEVFYLEDSNSTNGTRVNDKRIKEMELRRGDIIALGTTPLMIEGEDIPAREGDPAMGGGIERTVPAFKPRTTRSVAAVVRPKDFSTKRDHNRQWKAVIVVIGVVALVALAYFIMAMKK